MIAARLLTLDDIIMKVKLMVGDVVKRNHSYDSEYMLEAMDRVEKMIRGVFRWIHRALPYKIVMGSAGGCRKKDSINLYFKDL